MARAKIYGSNAERQAAYNERKREAERQRQAAIKEAAEHRARIAGLVIRDVAERLGRESEYHYQFRNDNADSPNNKLAREILRELARAIKQRRVL